VRNRLRTREPPVLPESEPADSTREPAVVVPYNRSTTAVVVPGRTDAVFVWRSPVE